MDCCLEDFSKEGDMVETDQQIMILEAENGNRY